MSPFHTLLTHPGGAHKDEFLACCVLLAKHPVPIVRREPNEQDLSDPGICVIDVGHSLDPSLHNFDHHQLPKDHPPTCALSLVMKHLGLYEDARLFCDWLETAEWFDCRGPLTTAKWLGVSSDVLSKLISPVDISLLKRFGASSELKKGQPVWEVMRMVGEDLVDYVQSLRDRLDFIKHHAVVWTLNIGGEPADILFVPRTDPLPEDPSMGVGRFIEMNGLAETVVGIVCPDRRSTGYGLSRYRDNPRLDFTRINQRPEVHFAHARGFVAKTTATETEHLKQLLILSGTKAESD